jgi:DNA (cytosine-5)-methyltransferase 1
MIRYASVCSGIEAPSVAWEPLGWKPVFFSEIEKFPSAALAHHYPDTPNLGNSMAVPVMRWIGERIQRNA